MATPFNGSQTVLRFKRALDTDYRAIAFQKDLSADAKRKLIDFSNKTSGDRSVYFTGLMDEDLKASVFTSDDATYQDLYNAFNSGETIHVAQYRSTDLHPDDTSIFKLIKSAAAVIQGLSEKYQFENVAMADIDIKISGKWTFA
jgi:hypothetical protein